MINSRKKGFTNVKGFTLVELVIVIAVVAILAAILIPTFSSLVKKANISADQQAVVHMNKLLAMDEVADPKPTTTDQVVEVLIKNGYSDDLTTYYSNYKLAWLEEENVVVLVEGTAIVYPEKYIGETGFEELMPMLNNLDNLVNEINSSTNGKMLFLSDDISKTLTIDSTTVDTVVNLNSNVITSNNGNAVRVRNDKIELKNGTIKSNGNEYHAVSGNGESTVTLNNINIIGQNDPDKNMLAIKTYSSTSTININNSVMTLIGCGGAEAAWGGTINLENVIISRSGDVANDYIQTAIAVSGKGTENVNGGKYSADTYCYMFIIQE